MDCAITLVLRGEEERKVPILHAYPAHFAADMVHYIGAKNIERIEINWWSFTKQDLYRLREIFSRNCGTKHLREGLAEEVDNDAMAEGDYTVEFVKTLIREPADLDIVTKHCCLHEFSPKVGRQICDYLYYIGVTPEEMVSDCYYAYFSHLAIQDLIEYLNSLYGINFDRVIADFLRSDIRESLFQTEYRAHLDWLLSRCPEISPETTSLLPKQDDSFLPFLKFCLGRTYRFSYISPGMALVESMTADGGHTSTEMAFQRADNNFMFTDPADDTVLII